MKVFYLSNIKSSNLFVAIIALFGLSSCGTYQSAYNDDDGIYSTSRANNNEVVETTDNGSDYFSLPYDEYKRIAEEDLITNIDDFNYNDDQTIQNDSIISTNSNAPWGYSDSANVNIYLRNNFDFFNNPYYNFYDVGFNNFYPYYGLYNSWRYRGVNYAYFNPYGFYYDVYCPPYFYNGYGGVGRFGFGNFFYANNFWGNNFWRNRYYRSYDSYGRRTAYNTRNNINRRAATGSTSRRSNISNTNSRTTRRSSTRINRTPSNTSRRSSTRTIRSNGNTIRRTPSNTRRNIRSSSNSTRTRSYQPSRTRSSSATRSTRSSSTTRSTRSSGSSRSTSRSTRRR